MSNTVLYALWAGLYALCAALGFVTGPGPALRLLMILLSAVLFVPQTVREFRTLEHELPSSSCLAPQYTFLCSEL